MNRNKPTTDKGQRGAMIPILAGLIPVFIGVLGLVIDNGQLYAEQRRMQAAADAAALGAAQEIRRDNPAGYQTHAIRNAERNGYAGEDVTLEINLPPLSGPMTGNPNFVEARLRRDVSMHFMGMFGRNDATVEARAVAGLRAGNACVYTLNQTKNKSLWVTGTANVTLSNCGIHVNSDSSNAAVTNGQATVQTGIIEIVGGYSGSGFTPTPETGAAQSDDPLAGLAAPSFGSCNHTELVKIQDRQILHPGVYCGGLEVTASGHAELRPGMYIIYGGGITVLGGARVEGAGVTFYLTEGPGYPYSATKFVGTAHTTLSAPTAGPYRGILFFMDRDVVTNEIHRFAGTAGTTFAGTIYMANAALEWSGTHDSVVQSVSILADTMTFKGDVNFTSLDVNGGMLPPLLTVARVTE